MNDTPTEWDLFLGSLPSELRQMIEDAIDGHELPSKDHPLFEILRQSFQTWFEQLDGTPEASAPAQLPQDFNPTDCLEYVKASSEVLSKTVEIIKSTATAVHSEAEKIQSAQEQASQETNRLINQIQESIAPLLGKTEAILLRTSKQRRWIPWCTAACACFLGFGILFTLSYDKAVNLARDRYETRYSQMEGVTKLNVATLKELSKLGVTITVVPDPQNDQYFLNMSNVQPFTGKAEIPGGHAVIFKVK